MPKDNSIRFSVPATDAEIDAAQQIITIHAENRDLKQLGRDIAKLNTAAERHLHDDPTGASRIAQLGGLAADAHDDISAGY